jgi:hypothetical protein
MSRLDEDELDELARAADEDEEEARADASDASPSTSALSAVTASFDRTFQKPRLSKLCTNRLAKSNSIDRNS